MGGAPGTGAALPTRGFAGTSDRGDRSGVRPRKGLSLPRFPRRPGPRSRRTSRGFPVPALLFLLLLGTAGCAGRRVAPAAGPPRPPGRGTAPAGAPREAGTWHVVRAGETLWRIARRYGVTVEAIARANGIPDPSRVRAGQRLFIPGARPGPAPSPGVTPREEPASPGGPWRWPVDGPVTSAFGAPRAHGGRAHTGIDIAAPAGTAVRAARGGRVAFAGRKGSYGRLVVVDHGRGFASWYAHLSRVLVHPGQHVAAGAVLGRVGATGNATGPHLHFEIRRRGRPLDPLLFLP